MCFSFAHYYTPLEFTRLEVGYQKASDYTATIRGGEVSERQSFDRLWDYVDACIME